MNPDLLLWSLITLPALAGLFVVALPSPRYVIGAMCAGVLGMSIPAAYTVYMVFTHGTIFAAGGWLFADSLSAFNLAVMSLVYCMSSAYAWVYFSEEIRSGHLTLRQSRLFAGFW